MNKISSFTTGVIISLFVWFSGKLLYDKAIEPWDSDVTFYLGQFFSAVFAFAFALRWRFVSVLLFMAGLLTGDILYLALFGNTDQKSLWIPGVTMSLSMLIYPIIAAILGRALRGIWIRFFATHAQTINEALLDKVDNFLQKPPKWAYRPVNFTQSAASGALKMMMIALFFGALGILLVIYPSPPLEPLPHYIQKFTRIMGYLFAGGFFWYGYRALRLYLGKGEWHIYLDDKKLLYHTPPGSGEPSFETDLDKIDKVEVITIYSNDESSSDQIYYLYTTSGQRYRLDSNKSRFAPHALAEALRARGIKIIRKSDR